MRSRWVNALAAGGAVAAIMWSLTPAWSASGASGAATTTTAASTTTTTVPAQDTLPAVTLDGEGSDDIYQEITDWSNDLYGNSGNLTLNYLPTGGYLPGTIGQNVDYVVSGVPLTSSQKASLGDSDLISAPIMPSGVGFLFNPPQGDFRVFDQAGNEIQQFDGPYNIPYPNITAMMLDYGGRDPSTGDLEESYEEWDNSNITATWPGLEFDPSAGDTLGASTFIGVGPLVYERSEPSETAYYLQQMMLTEDPSLFSTALKSDDAPVVPTLGSITETLPPSAPVQGRDGVQLQVQALLANSGSQYYNGTVADVPPSAIAQVQQFNANQLAEKLDQVEVQWLGVANADGQYLDPSPSSIDASIDAGGAQPLYGLTHRVYGGYPLTYVDDLYAPAHGLSQATTEALATTIRYLVTDGQVYTAQFNDGQLSAPLVSQALAAANELVDSNCTEKGEEILTSTNPGPYAPDLPGIQSIGQMDNCVSVGSSLPSGVAPTPLTTTTTTTVASTTTTTVPGAPASSSLGGSLTGGSSTSGSGGSAGAPKPISPPAATPPPALKKKRIGASELTAAVAGSGDLETPSSGTGGFDHLAALVLGALLFIVLRKPLLNAARSLGS